MYIYGCLKAIFIITCSCSEFCCSCIRSASSFVVNFIVFAVEVLPIVVDVYATVTLSFACFYSFNLINEKGCFKICLSLTCSMSSMEVFIIERTNQRAVTVIFFTSMRGLSLVLILYSYSYSYSY